ncbi:MAG: 2-hydroxyacid dehydrogenase [Bacteroidota bacterium]
MKVAVYSFHQFEQPYLEAANQHRFEFVYLEAELNLQNAILARGCEAVMLFTSDDASAAVLEALHAEGVRYLALRTAGYNHVDLVKARKLGMRVARVPSYSPYAIAEHTVAMILALNRKLIRAHSRIRESNFSLNGLTGFDMNGKTVGVVGTGKIGAVLVKILHGFGCRILSMDLHPDQDLVAKYGVEYSDLETLCRSSDIICLLVPLNKHTHYLINEETIAMMKPGVMLINTSRGAIVKTKAVIEALKTRHIGSFGTDVYEEEEGLFFQDHSEDILQDDVIARLMTFPNVLITSHQAFLTDTALLNIAEATIENLSRFAAGEENPNELLLA